MDIKQKDLPIIVIVGAVLTLLIITPGFTPIDFFSRLISVAAPQANANTLVTKIDIDGNQQWQIILEGLAPPWVRPDSDGGYLIYGGTAFPGNILPSLTVSKIRADGNLSWNFIKSPTAYYPGVPILDAAKYVFPGNTGYTVIDGHGVVIRLDAGGTEQWHRYYYTNLMDAKTTPDGGYALAGTFFYRKPGESSSSEDTGWVIRLDPAGDRVWEYTGHQYLECRSLTLQEDGTLQAACYGSGARDLLTFDLQGNVSGTTPLPPDNGTVSFQNPGPIVPISTVVLPNGSVALTFQPRGSGVQEVVIHNSASTAGIKNTYAVVSTGDKGFLVFSAV